MPNCGFSRFFATCTTFAAIMALLATTAALGNEGPLTNEEVIRLTETGIGGAVIVAKIEGSLTDFDTSVTGLVTLGEAGVDDKVLAAMVRSADAVVFERPSSAAFHEKPVPDRNVRSQFEPMRDALVAGDYELLRTIAEELLSTINHVPPPLVHYMYAIALQRTRGDPAKGWFHVRAYLDQASPTDPHRRPAAILLSYFEELKHRSDAAERYAVGSVSVARGRFGYSVVNVDRPDRLAAAESVFALLPDEVVRVAVLEGSDATTIKIAYAQSVHRTYDLNGDSVPVVKSVPEGSTLSNEKVRVKLVL